MEKLKVNISDSVYQILKKDMELFKFFKTDGSTNANLFINTLIANYYNFIENEENILNKGIKKILNDNPNIRNNEIDSITSKITEYILGLDYNEEEYNCSISFKPTKISIDAINNIEYQLNNKGISKYFRLLFSNYAKKPLYQREKIIFKDKVDIIDYSIKNKTAISLKLNDKRYTYYPYKLLYSGEELFNYLVCCDEFNNITSLRLTNIHDLIKTKAPFVIQDEIIKKLDEMIKLGPQFACDIDSIMEYIIKLTPQGIKKFNKIYIHRPKPYKIEDNLYYFKCSYDQMYQYFFRFGKDAYVISPSTLSKRLRLEYKEASKHYSDEFFQSLQK